MTTVIYTADVRKPSPTNPKENTGTTVYAHAPETGKVKGTKS